VSRRVEGKRHLALAPDEARHLRGQIVRQNFERAQWRKIIRQIVHHELENALGLAQILQPALAEIAQHDFRRQRAAHDFRRNMRQQTLSAVAHRKNAGHAIERWTEVIIVALLGLTRVHGHADAQGSGLFPRGGGKPALGRHGGIDRVVRVVEGHAKGVADGLENIAIKLLECGAQQRVMLRQRAAHRLGMRFPQLGTPLDVGKKKGEVFGVIQHGAPRRLRR